MHVAWSYCQADRLVAKRETINWINLIKKSLLVHKYIKIQQERML